MNKHASTYIYGVIALGVVLILLVALQTDYQAQPGKYLLAACLVIVTIGSQIGKVLYKSRGDTAGGTSWYTPLLSFMFAGVLTLPPYLIVALVIIPHLVEWAAERARNTSFLRDWFIQPFNIATHLVCVLVTWEIYLHGVPVLTTVLGSDLAAKLVTSVLAGVVYLIINHYLVGQVMVLACRITWKQSGVLEAKNLACDLGFLLIGTLVAIVVDFSPIILLAAILPLLFVQRRLATILVQPA